MQTFLPYADFRRSAQVLDRARLGKQRLECKQLVQALEAKARGEKAGWQNHPAALMWEGHIIAMCDYALQICDEWTARGYKDTMRSFFHERFMGLGERSKPSWVGDERVHASHRARLKQKDPVHYGQFNWSEEPCGPEGYVWPVRRTS